MIWAIMILFAAYLVAMAIVIYGFKKVSLFKAEEFAAKHDTTFCENYNKVVNHNGIDTVIVATTNKFLTQISDFSFQICLLQTNNDLFFVCNK